MRYCTHCGILLEDHAIACPRCRYATIPAPAGIRPFGQQPVSTMTVVQFPQPQPRLQPQPAAVQPAAPQQTVPQLAAPQQNEQPQPHRGRIPNAKEVVSVKGLYKRYSRKAAWAVTDVTFNCYEGEIVGLLGHNGAGKSTTLKCLEGMLPFEQGEIKIAGYDIRKQAEKAKARMGFVTDNHATFVKMTGIQYLNFMADVYEVPTKLRLKRLKELDEVFQLGKPIENLISSYSHGMRQKICMMGSLIHHPKLWILDEPMTGLDPRTMRAVQDFMHAYAAQGNSIIFSSHALNTVAKLCDRVVLIRKGRQVNELDVGAIYARDPNFDFEEYFLRNEGQEE